MRLMPAPPIATPRRAALLALVLTLVIIAMLIQREAATSLRTLGDTDDAMRLVFVRELLSGKGWFDQQSFRLQPPVGLFPHWSRLIDGGLAALYRLLALVLPPAQAERGMRIVWPLLWIYPAMVAALAIAVRLGQGPQRLETAARATAVAAAVLLVSGIPLYSQFRPNRIDHHDVQIVCCIASLLGLAWGRWKGGVLAGIATGVGSAIGLEALIFEAVIAAGFAWRFIQARDDGSSARAYGLALAAATAAAFLIQTPPTRWLAAACDGIAYNLVATLAGAGLGMALAVTLAARRGPLVRLAALVPVGLLAAGLYAGLDPHCLKGPFADVDPRIKPIWLDHVQEVKPWLYQLKRGPAFAITLMVPTVMGLLAWLWLGFAPGRTEGRRLDPLWLTSGLALIVAATAMWSAIRVGSYCQWLAAPLIAAAMGDIAARYLKGSLLGVLALSIALCPAVVDQGVTKLHKALQPPAASKKAPAKPAQTTASSAKAPPGATARAKPAAKPATPGCFDIAAWAPLAKVPAGLVLSEVDLGPFILAHTQMSALRAPYHRMSYGILKGYQALAAPADEAAQQVRALGVSYVLECPSHRRQSDRDSMKPESLQKQLDAGKAPGWLEVVVKAPALTLYRVRPAPAPIG